MAAHLGKFHSELQSGMDYSELVTWQAYVERNGFPHRRMQATVAIGNAAICTLWAKSGTIKPKDLMPNYQPVQQITPHEGMKMFAAWAKARNKRLENER